MLPTLIDYVREECAIPATIIKIKVANDIKAAHITEKKRKIAKTKKEMAQK